MAGGINRSGREHGFCYTVPNSVILSSEYVLTHNVIRQDPLNMNPAQITIRPLKQDLEVASLTVITILCYLAAIHNESNTMQR